MLAHPEIKDQNENIVTLQTSLFIPTAEADALMVQWHKLLDNTDPFFDRMPHAERLHMMVSKAITYYANALRDGRA